MVWSTFPAQHRLESEPGLNSAGSMLPVRDNFALNSCRIGDILMATLHPSLKMNSHPTPSKGGVRLALDRRQPVRRWHTPDRWEPGLWTS